MKKILLLISLFISSIAYANSATVKVFNNSKTGVMEVTYQICAISLSHRAAEDDECDTAHYTTTIQSIKYGKHYADIVVPDAYSYVKILQAIEKEGSIIKAQADFTQSFCHGFTNLPILLDDIQSSPFIVCSRAGYGS